MTTENPLPDMRRRWLSLVGLIEAASFVAIICSIAPLADFAHRYLELFSHFRLQYLLSSLLLALILLVLRRRTYGALMLTVTLLNAGFVAPWYLSPEQGVAAGAPRIKLLHANVLTDNESHAELLDLVASENPDLVFVQELTPEWSQALTALHADYPYRHTEPRYDSFGIAVYSRIRLDSVELIRSPPLDFPTLRVQTSISGTALTLISTHPIHPLGRSLYAARNEQLASIADTVMAGDGPTILVGDLNISMWSHHYRELERATGLRNARHGFGILPTWPTFLPIALIPIDHCLVSPGVGVLDMKTGPGIGSDHLPLIVTLAIENPSLND